MHRENLGLSMFVRDSEGNYQLPFYHLIFITNINASPISVNMIELRFGGLEELAVS